MDWITKLLEIFLSNTYKVSHKLWVIISVVASILIVDNHFGFSSHWRTKSKIEEAVAIQELIVKTHGNNALNKKLLSLQDEIIESKNLSNYFLDLFSNIFTTTSASLSKTVKTPIAANTDSIIEYSLVYHVVSTSFWFILLFLAVFFFSVINIYESKKLEIKDIKTFFQINGVIITIIIVLSFLTYLIPKFNPPFANYIINFLITTMLIIGFVIIIIIQQNKDLQKKHDNLISQLKKVTKVGN
ncbi:hypothetical protein LV89_02031 [Arcicella aurantiaca]|uniref:Uncharacterized protein n=1 Tax=Arcicella aurantiaca TaxID=591202 RepID=A0A316EBY4_9BACT|nr:hypothetical protein [Arcicella aurantiaca]PWK27214.1 hypothetical protein LV89_02031 [Arcicella aurantiaca]